MKKIQWNFNNSYETLPSFFYDKIDLSPVKKPKWVVLNEDLAQFLGLDPEALKEEGFLPLSGSEFPENASQIAQSYMGHQFGFPSILGDGRALLLGEQITPKGERYDLQLKGSGPTPYSRNGDGRATLQAMLREFLISEAMFGLGIPTTRSLAVVSTGEPVYRERAEKGAILTRVAASHLRVGTFEWAAHSQIKENLISLADYAIQRHYPELENAEDKYFQFYLEVQKRQAKLLAQWMSVGFIHGVMNTDNMTISGETIDYGPCAFLDVYAPQTVYSSIDIYGRYAYEKQPQMAAWNLARFGQALSPLIGETHEKAMERVDGALEEFAKEFQREFYRIYGRKLGLSQVDGDDRKLIHELLEIMEKNSMDYTNTFVDLTLRDWEQKIYQRKDFFSWKEKWLKRLEKENPEEVEKRMKNSNPYIIPRNYWVEQALFEAKEGNLDLFLELWEALKSPYDYEKHKEKFRFYKEIFGYKTYCGT